MSWQHVPTVRLKTTQQTTTMRQLWWTKLEVCRLWPWPRRKKIVKLWERDRMIQTKMNTLTNYTHPRPEHRNWWWRHGRTRSKKQRHSRHCVFVDDCLWYCGYRNGSQSDEMENFLSKRFCGSIYSSPVTLLSYYSWMGIQLKRRNTWGRLW